MDFPEKEVNNISLEESYNRAQSKINKKEYDLFKNNCEHFALWCRTGKASATQAFGSESSHYSSACIALPINLPSIVGKFYNDIGMVKSRTMSIFDL